MSDDLLISSVELCEMENLNAVKLADAIDRLRQYASVLDSNANADASEPNLREDIEAVCLAAAPAASRGVPTLEAAKRMQHLNATLQLRTQVWSEIDEREQQHWIDLASIALTAPPLPADGVRESRTLGSSIDLLIGLSFKYVETLNPDAKHKHYRECGCCGGTDEHRDHYKPDISKVQHAVDCPLARDLPILKAIGAKSDALAALASPHEQGEG